MSVIPIHNSAELSEHMSDSSTLIVIDFTASWCPPCQMIKPIFEALAKQYTNVKFLKVDVDEASDVAQAYGIRAMPTFIFLKGTKEEKRITGADPNAIKTTLIALTKSASSGAFSGQGRTLSSDKGQTSSSVPSTHDVSNSLTAAWSNLNPQAKVLIALCAAYAFFWLI